VNNADFGSRLGDDPEWRSTAGTVIAVKPDQVFLRYQLAAENNAKTGAGLDRKPQLVMGFLGRARAAIRAYSASNGGGGSRRNPQQVTLWTYRHPFCQLGHHGYMPPMLNANTMPRERADKSPPKPLRRLGRAIESRDGGVIFAREASFGHRHRVVIDGGITQQ